MTDRHTLSTDHQREGDARRPKDTLDRGQTPQLDDPDGRGVRAHVDAETGAVKGSGMSAGGGNPGEDYDIDPKSGDGTLPETDSRRPAGSDGGDA